MEGGVEGVDADDDEFWKMRLLPPGTPCVFLKKQMLTWLFLLDLMFCSLLLQCFKIGSISFILYLSKGSRQ